MISNLQIVDFWNFPLRKFRPFLTVSDRDLGKHNLVSCYLWRQLTPGNSVALSLEGSQGPLYTLRLSSCISLWYPLGISMCSSDFCHLLHGTSVSQGQNLALMSLTTELLAWRSPQSDPV